MRVAFADICTCHYEFAVGSKIRMEHIDRFWEILERGIRAHDFEADRVPGQGFILLPDAVDYVSAGCALRTDNPLDYFPHLHREKVALYMKRWVSDRVTDVASCAAVVYTIEAYLRDPDVTEKEAARIQSLEANHVFVALIAAPTTDPSPLTPRRLVANLAGGNHEALAWSADEIRARAEESNEFWNRYATVAG